MNKHLIWLIGSSMGAASLNQKALGVLAFLLACLPTAFR